jgi:hypothetical protein
LEASRANALHPADNTSVCGDRQPISSPFVLNSIRVEGGNGGALAKHLGIQEMAFTGSAQTGETDYGKRLRQPEASHPGARGSLGNIRRNSFLRGGRSIGSRSFRETRMENAVPKD